MPIAGLTHPRARGATGLLLLLAVVSCLGACAARPMTLRYFPDGELPPEARNWPRMPEVPRYRYAGKLLGEDNFVPVEDREPSRVQRFLEWVAGLDAGDADRMRVVRPHMGLIDPAGRILVSDVGRGAVFVFDEASPGLQVWKLADQSSSFMSPAGIALGPGNEIYVADADLGRIVRLDRDGNPLGSFGSGAVNRPTGLARDANRQRTYVVDSGAHNIKVFDDSGRHVATLGRRGEAPGEFNGPTHIALDGERLIVSDTLNARVQIITHEGKPITTIGRRGLYVGNLSRPKGVAVDSDGNLYVTESYFDHVLVFDSEGRFLLPISGSGAEGGRFFLPAGIWTDRNDRVFVADMFNARVVMFQYLGE